MKSILNLVIISAICGTLNGMDVQKKLTPQQHQQQAVPMEREIDLDSTASIMTQQSDACETGEQMITISNDDAASAARAAAASMDVAMEEPDANPMQVDVLLNVLFKNEKDYEVKEDIKSIIHNYVSDEFKKAKAQKDKLDKQWKSRMFHSCTTGRMTALDVSGDSIVVGSFTGEIILFDMQSGKVLKWLKHKHKEKNKFFYDHDKIFSLKICNGNILYENKHGKIKMNLHSGGTTILDKDKYITAISDDKIAIVFPNAILIKSLRSGETLHRLVGRTDDIKTIAISDNKLISASNEEIKIFDLNSGNLLHELYYCGIESPVFSGDKIIFGYSCKIIIVDIKTGQELSKILAGGRVDTLAISGNKIICGFKIGDYGYIQIFENPAFEFNKSKSNSAEKAEKKEQ